DRPVTCLLGGYPGVAGDERGSGVGAEGVRAVPAGPAVAPGRRADGERAVVSAGVADPVAVAVPLVGIGDRQTVVAGVPHAVTVRVRLGRVRDCRTIVDAITHTVAVCIRARMTGQFVKAFQVRDSGGDLIARILPDGRAVGIEEHRVHGVVQSVLG